MWSMTDRHHLATALKSRIAFLSATETLKKLMNIAVYMTTSSIERRVSVVRWCSANIRRLNDMAARAERLIY